MVTENKFKSSEVVTVVGESDLGNLDFKKNDLCSNPFSW